MLRAAVLAGGLSSRMGSDKALLQLNGITLLERSVALLRQCGADQVLVSGRPDHPLGVPDLLPHCGPPGAVLSLLHWLEQRTQLDGAPLLLVPVDMPLLTPVVMKPLLDAAATTTSCRYQQEIFPCVVPATRELLLHLRQLFDKVQAPGGERSMRALFSFLKCRELPIENAGRALLANINTPEDWRGISG